MKCLRVGSGIMKIFLLAILWQMLLGLEAHAKDPQKPITKPEKPVVLKMASAAMGKDYIEMEERFVKSFNKRCAPHYKIEFYPAQQMVSFPELLDAVRTGVAEIGVITFNAYSALEPKLGFVELPFLFNNVQAIAYAAPRLEPLYAEIMIKKFNQKVLCCHHYTGVDLFSSRPVKKLKDWQGLVVQSLSPVTSAIAQALGAAAVAIPYTESYTALQKGTVDATFNAIAAGRVFALYEVTRYLTVAFFSGVLHGYTINLQAWNKLPKDVQDILLEEARRNSDEYSQWLLEDWDRDIDRLKKAGMEIYQVPQAERDLWKEKCEKYIANQLLKYGDFGQMAMKIVKDANQRYPR